MRDSEPLEFPSSNRLLLAAVRVLENDELTGGVRLLQGILLVNYQKLIFLPESNTGSKETKFYETKGQVERLTSGVSIHHIIKLRD